jgi:hypothetical protein
LDQAHGNPSELPGNEAQLVTWSERSRMRALKLAEVLPTALALIPSSAHFFELFNKISLLARHYFD